MSYKTCGCDYLLTPIGKSKLLHNISNGHSESNMNIKELLKIELNFTFIHEALQYTHSWGSMWCIDTQKQVMFELS